jgi:ABC-type lipoprotein release transport system permease subunit
MALGSTPAGVMRLVLATTVRLASVGMAAGLALGLAATSFLSWIFFGLEPFDLRVFGTAAALLGGSALSASWWPARRAAQVQPASIMKL